MTTDQQLEQQLHDLGKTMAANIDFTAGVMHRIKHAGVVSAEGSQHPTWARLVQYRVRRLLVIAAVVLLVIWQWPGGNQSDIAFSEWWLGSSTVYAGEIVEELQKAQEAGVLFRGTTVYVLQDGTEEPASAVQTIAVAGDRYRYESTTNGQLGMVTWTVPDGDEFVVTKFLASQDSLRVRREPRDRGPGASPLARVLELGRLIDQARERLDPRDIDGLRCVGFEIEAGKVHRKHKSGSYRIWIATETKRPVKIIFDRESRIRHDGESRYKRVVSITDGFEWNPELPDNTFEPHPNPQPLR